MTTKSPSPTVSGQRAGQIASFSGNGSGTTKKFSAATNWQIVWRAGAGSGFKAELIDSHGASRGDIVTAGKKTSGATFVSLAGTFRLKVTAKGSWSIKVTGRPA
jgi:hypothetical protein